MGGPPQKTMLGSVEDLVHLELATMSIISLGMYFSKSPVAFAHIHQGH